MTSDSPSPRDQHQGSPCSPHAWMPAALTVAACVYYLMIITNGTFNLLAPEAFSNLFDEMARGLLRLDLTFRQDILGREAYIWKDRINTYFGILPAIPRIPMILLFDPTPPPLSRLSCWLALCCIAWGTKQFVGNVFTLLFPGMSNMLPVMMLVLAISLFTAPLFSLTFSAWVYNEPIVWAIAMMVCAQNVLARELMSGANVSIRNWVILGGLSGLTFSIRPTVALCMVLSAGMLMLTRVIQHLRVYGLRLGAMPAATAFVAWGFALCLCMAPALLVNWVRWDNPFAFAPLTAHIQVMEDPRRLQVAETYGAISALRVPLGIAYYVLGLMNDGWTDPMASRLSDGLGWPRSAFAVTSTIQLLLGTVFVYAVGFRHFRQTPEALRKVFVLLVGPSALAGIMLMFIYMNYRYRVEFYPLFLLVTAAGLGVMQQRGWLVGWLPRTALVTLLIVNIVVSHLDVTQAKLASFAQSSTEQARIRQLIGPVGGLFRPSP